MPYDPQIPLVDPTLLGNECAEDEKDSVFTSYAYHREEISQFASEESRILIARAYKGEGKSALLRLAKSKLEIKQHHWVVSANFSEFSPTIDLVDYQKSIRSWKENILLMLASFVGSKIDIAWDPDSIALVEDSEKKGAKKKNLLSLIMDRIEASLSVPLTPGAIPAPGAPAITIKAKGASHSPEAIQEIFSRWKLRQSEIRIWLFIDDIDKNFKNDDYNKTKIMSFFDALRDLSNSLNNVFFRTGIRPNIWATLRRQFESNSHIDQYMLDIAWSEDNIKHLLARRVEGWLKRNGKLEKVKSEILRSVSDSDRALIALIFQDPMSWNGQRPPHVPISTLTKLRPRWVIELSKNAAKHAHSERRRRILFEDLEYCLKLFGEERASDTIAEFLPICPQVSDLINAFFRSKEELTTSELFDVIKKTTDNITVTLEGHPRKPNVRDVASFLFEAGIFYGKYYRDNGSYEHITFAERPHLFKSTPDMDSGLCWEIHPCYRHFLQIRTQDGRPREIKPFHASKK